jgi:hypothetical protein
VNTSSLSGRRIKQALLAGALNLPALLLVCSGVLQSLTGIDFLDSLAPEIRDVLLHPAVLLTGLVGVLLVCAFSVIQLHWCTSSGALTCSLQVKNRLLDVGLMALSSALLSAILAYAFFENFRIVAR